MDITHVGEGEVVLIAGGDKCYTDVAARFCHSKRDLDDILATPYDSKLVSNILSSGHLAASEFDYFLFGVTGYARVTEIQLVRKRLASYLISSGRDNRNGKRKFEVVLPNDIEDFKAIVPLNKENLFVLNSDNEAVPIQKQYPDLVNDKFLYSTNANDLLESIETWYNTGVGLGIPEEDLRYMKPQATAFKAIIGMNAHALLDWFMIRTCQNAQTEIRDLAVKMMKLCKEAQPDIFKDAGPSCVRLGYCPENARQNVKCSGHTLTKDQALNILEKYKEEKLAE